jgi:hypothetical protein
VARELQRRGHEAVTWGPEQPVPLGGFDLGIIANAKDTKRAFDLCKTTINVSHGIIDAEKPTGDVVVCTSEEIRTHWGVEAKIIRQPIDLTFWHPMNKGAEYLTRFSYRGGLGFVARIAEELGLKSYHLRNSSEEVVRNVLHRSACVLATGRAALEAMACNVPVVICDHRSAYQPPLMHLNIKHAMVRNYSGRGGITPNHATVKRAVEEAMQHKGNRFHVEKFHDVRDIVDELLELVI